MNKYKLISNFCVNNSKKLGFRYKNWKTFSSSSRSITNTIPENAESLHFKKYNAVFKFQHRKVVSVTGEDAETFLQSMMTNDMKLLKDDRVALFAAFLNPKGRVLFDSIIVKSHFSDQTYPDFWIDVHQDNREDLIRHLEAHCLRKKVFIQDLSGLMDVHGAVSLLVGAGPNMVEEGRIWKQLQDTAEYFPSEENPEVMVTESMAFYDPRLKSLGCRIISPIDSLDIEQETINLKFSPEDYEIIRMLYCVPEGPKELRDKFPLNMNLHFLNGISFNKGCYIGQELTQRTHHTGVLRKVAMPFVVAKNLVFKIGDENSENFQGHILIPFKSIDRKFKMDLNGKNILDPNGDVIGTVINSQYNCGIAMVDKEKLINAVKPEFSIEGQNTILYDPVSVWDSIKELHT